MKALPIVKKDQQSPVYVPGVPRVNAGNAPFA